MLDVTLNWRTRTTRHLAFQMSTHIPICIRKISGCCESSIVCDNGGKIKYSTVKRQSPKTNG